MRQETIIKTYLKFDELNDQQKKKVLDELRDINVDGDYWFDHIYEDYQEKLKRLGFYKINFRWSGFWSQGNGASFSAKHRRGDVTLHGLYSHEGSMSCDDKAVLLVARRIARQLYRDLEKDYEYLTSDEAVIETIQANDYEFDQETLKIV